MSKVSILLPVYNSVTKTERTDFLQQMINSILNQTHKDLELLILDNQSVDNTLEICNGIASKDSRVKVYVDTERRPAEEAHNKLIGMADGEFAMLIADDDILNYHYIEALINTLKTNKDIDMAYTNGAYINRDNQIIQGLITNTDGMYDSEYYYDNFYKAIHKRKVLPIVYGIFKKEVLQSLMPYTPFDQLRANMDNLLMAKFFLNRHTIAFVNHNLFYYRHRDRSLNPEELDYMPTNPILIWVYYTRHQLYFYHAVCSLIEETNQGDLTESLKIATLDSCLNQSIVLLNWVARDLVKDEFEYAIIKEIYEQFKPIYELKLSCLAHTKEVLRTQQDTMRLRCKILEERVMEYIKTVVQDTTIVDDTQNVIKKIKTSLITQLNSV